MAKMTNKAFEDLTKTVRVEDLMDEFGVSSLFVAMKKVFGPIDESVYELGYQIPDSYAEDPEAIPPDSDEGGAGDFWVGEKDERHPFIAPEEEATERQPWRRTPAEAEEAAVRRRHAEVLEELRDFERKSGEDLPAYVERFTKVCERYEAVGDRICSSNKAELLLQKANITQAQEESLLSAAGYDYSFKKIVCSRCRRRVPRCS